MTAAHCYKELFDQKFLNQNGDYEVTYDYNRRKVRKYWGIKRLGGPLPPWRTNIDPPHWSEIYEDDEYPGMYDKFYRQIHKIIVHGDYAKSDKSWKGSDLALIKLGLFGSEWKNITERGKFYSFWSWTSGSEWSQFVREGNF